MIDDSEDAEGDGLDADKKPAVSPDDGNILLLSKMIRCFYCWYHQHADPS